MKPLPVVVNPAARGGRSHPPCARLEHVAAGHGWRIEWWETQHPGHATELAREAVAQGREVVAVWGGDGTYNEAARGLVGSETAMIVLPGGTTSVLAYEFAIPRRADAALAVQLEGRRAPMRVGRTDRGQVFLIMLSAGPDSLILTRLPVLLKRWAGKAGITLQAVAVFLTARLPRLTVEADGRSQPVSWCIAGKSRCYGGPWPATPGADPFRPDFELVTLTRFGRPAVVPFFFRIPGGSHVAMAGVERHLAPTFTLTAERPVPYQLDGDAAGWLPVSAAVAPEPLWLMLPG